MLRPTARHPTTMLRGEVATTHSQQNDEEQRIAGGQPDNTGMDRHHREGQQPHHDRQTYGKTTATTVTTKKNCSTRSSQQWYGEQRFWTTIPDNKRVDIEQLNLENVPDIQQNIGKINIISDEDLDKKFDNKIWIISCNNIVHNKTWHQENGICRGQRRQCIQHQTKHSAGKHRKQHSQQECCSAELAHKNCLTTMSFDNNLDKDEWNNDIEKNTNNKENIEKGQLNKDIVQQHWHNDWKINSSKTTTTAIMRRRSWNNKMTTKKFTLPTSLRWCTAPSLVMVVNKVSNIGSTGTSGTTASSPPCWPTSKNNDQPH